MDNILDQLPEEKSTVWNEEISGYLLETSKWGKFLAIVGYVGMGLLILLAIVMMVGLSAMSGMMGTGFPMGLVGLVYIVLAVLYYFPVTYLYRFSVQIKQGIYSKEEATITTAFQNMKSLFRFMGIMTIVILSIYALVLLVSVPAALLLRHSY